MTRLYFDLDGTLIDVRKRHYAAYAEAAHDLGLTPLSEQDFWDYRRDGAETEDLLGALEEADRERFEERWRELFDEPSYVRLDALIPGARQTLAKLRESYELVLVSLREDREALLDQLEELALRKFFKSVYSPLEPDKAASKADLIKRQQDRNGDDVAFVGDSEEDIAAARELGIDAVSVTTGVRGRRYLEARGPDEVISSVRELLRILRGDS